MQLGAAAQSCACPSLVEACFSECVAFQYYHHWAVLEQQGCGCLSWHAAPPGMAVGLL